jgi:hypothetical protein
MAIEWGTAPKRYPGSSPSGNDPYPAIYILPKHSKNNDWIRDLLTMGGWPESGIALIIQMPTEIEARDRAGAVQNAFWRGRFVIYGDPNLVAEIKGKL